MKKSSLFAFLFLAITLMCYSFNAVHEYYISITHIDYNPKSKTIEISQQYIAHDVEKAIFKEQNVDLHLAEPNEHPKADSLLALYFQENFKISTDTAVQLNWVGREVKLDETLLIYLQSESMQEPAKLTVKNTSLTNVFPAQSNITHVKVGEKQLTKSINRITNAHTFITQ